METLEWSKPQIVETFSRCRTLGQVIEEIEATYWSKGFVVCDVKLNGQLLSEDQETLLASTHSEQIDHLRVRLYRVGQLLIDTKRSILDWIERAERACEANAEEFRAGRLKEAHGRFSELMAGSQWLAQNIQLLRGLVDLDDEPHHHADWGRNEANFMKTVRDINGAYERQDFAQLSDIIEYELTTALRDWARLLGALPALSDC
jgi:hypothetical protein